MYHRLGTPSEADLLVYANPASPVWLYGCEVTDDGAYLIITTSKGTDPVNRLYYAHLPSVWEAWKERRAAAEKGSVGLLAPGALPPPQSAYEYLPLVRAIDDFSASWEVISNDGEDFLLRTNLEAPRYRIVHLKLPPAAAPTDPSVVPPPGDGGAEGGTRGGGQGDVMVRVGKGQGR